MDVGCETALRAVRDGLIGGDFARALIGMPYLNCGTSGLDFLDKLLKPVACLVNVNTT